MVLFRLLNERAHAYTILNTFIEKVIKKLRKMLAATPNKPMIGYNGRPQTIALELAVCLEINQQQQRVHTVLYTHNDVLGNFVANGLSLSF